MGQIQSSIGLITGIPIQDTVDQLMKIAAQPRDMLESRNSQLQMQQTAVVQLTSLVLAMKLSVDRLGREKTFQEKSVNSSNSRLLSAAVSDGGDPTVGTYRLTPVRQAQTEQLLSSSFGSLDGPIGEGSLSFRFGGFVNEGVDLDMLNGGAGVRRGYIRITDRSGATADVDLRFVQTVDDVLEAINATAGVNVTATAAGDAFRLVDNTGQTAGNLMVQEVGGGQTASDLGLAGINVAADTATGRDVLRLYGGLAIDRLNDGMGVGTDDALPDLEVTFRDGSGPLQIDFHSLGAPGFSEATTDAAAGVDAQVRFTAVQAGTEFDGVTIHFLDDTSITKGNETVAYDDSDPSNKTLRFHIDGGQTDANDIVNALNNDPVASRVFTAAVVGTGDGMIHASDTAVTDGAAAVPPPPETTLGDLIATINAADPTRLRAEIAADGQRIVLTDLTTGAGAFSVRSLFGGSVAEDLGLSGNFLSGDFNGDGVVDEGDLNVLLGDSGSAYSLEDLRALLASENSVSAASAAALAAPNGGVGDINNDGVVNDADLNLLLSGLGSTYSQDDLRALLANYSAAAGGGGGGGVGDINNDGVVDDADLNLLLSGLGSTYSQNDLRALLANYSAAAGGGGGGGVGDINRDGAVDDADLNLLLSSLGAHSLDDLRSVLDNFGATAGPTSGQITGSRLLGGLKTSLLSNLKGGSGIGNLGTIQLVDRSGAGATVDLSSAETLDDVIEMINASTVGITARVNRNRSGVELIDTTGATTGNLIVANGDATGTADVLGVAVDAATTTVDGGSLDLQIVSRSTLLDSLNGGRGVRLGSFVVTDSAGQVGAVKLAAPGMEADTVGDVMDAINALNIGVSARINDTGDGILLLDTAGGGGALSVREVGNGTTAGDLRLLGAAEQRDIGGAPTQVIDGSTTFRIDIAAGDSLTDVIDNVNALDAGVTAGYLGIGSQFRLTLASDASGRAGRLQMDTSGIDFRFDEITRGADALVSFGLMGGTGGGILISSPDNTFDEAMEGLSLTIGGASTSPVTVEVGATDSGLIDAANQFVTSFNALRKTLDDYTFFKEEDSSTGILFGSIEALRTEMQLADVLTGRFFGVGRLQSLEAVGISLGKDGKLSFDQSKLKTVFAEDPEAVRELFTNEESGISAKLNAVIESLADADNSLLVNRQDAISAKVDANKERIARMEARLDAERRRLLIQFYRMESVVGKLRNNLSTIAAISPMPLIAFGASGSNQ